MVESALGDLRKVYACYKRWQSYLQWLGVCRHNRQRVLSYGLMLFRADSGFKFNPCLPAQESLLSSRSRCQVNETLPSK